MPQAATASGIRPWPLRCAIKPGSPTAQHARPKVIGCGQAAGRASRGQLRQCLHPQTHTVRAAALGIVPARLSVHTAAQPGGEAASWQRQASVAAAPGAPAALTQMEPFRAQFTSWSTLLMTYCRESPAATCWVRQGSSAGCQITPLQCSVGPIPAHPLTSAPGPFAREVAAALAAMLPKPATRGRAGAAGLPATVRESTQRRRWSLATEQPGAVDHSSAVGQKAFPSLPPQLPAPAAHRAPFASIDARPIG